MARKSSACCSSSLFIPDDFSGQMEVDLQLCRCLQNSRLRQCPAALLGASQVSLLVTAMALQRLQEEKELAQPLMCWACQPLCRQEQSGGDRQAAQVDLAHRYFDISCLARTRIGCHQGFLNQVPYLLLILSIAEPGFVVCHISPSHSAGLLFPP